MLPRPLLPRPLTAGITRRQPFERTGVVCAYSDPRLCGRKLFKFCAGLLPCPRSVNTELLSLQQHSANRIPRRVESIESMSHDNPPEATRRAVRSPELPRQAGSVNAISYVVRGCKLAGCGRFFLPFDFSHFHTPKNAQPASKQSLPGPWMLACLIGRVRIVSHCGAPRARERVAFEFGIVRDHGSRKPVCAVFPVFLGRLPPG